MNFQNLDQKVRWNATNIFILVCTIIITPIFGYVMYSIFFKDGGVLSLGYAVMLVGTAFEYLMSVKWKSALLTFLGTCALSLPILIPGAFNHSSEKEIFDGWIMLFYAMFLLIVIGKHFSDFFPKINEGIVLMQSIAITYWVLSNQSIDINEIWIDVTIVTGVILSVYTLYHAISYTQHTRTSRLFLSIWSAFIVFVLGIDNANKVLALGEIENLTSIGSIILLTAQYFLLGISIIYLAKSFMMVFVFIAGRGDMEKKDYKKAMHEIKGLHIARMDTKQLKRAHALAAIIFTGIIFSVNYSFNFFPANFAIWVVFITFPVAIFFYDKLFPSPEANEHSLADQSYYRNYKRFR